MFISILLLGDFSLELLTLLQMYSISLLDFLLVLFVLPLAVLFPFPAGISALFSHGPKRSAGLARVYALWNITSLINVVSFLNHVFHIQESLLEGTEFTDMGAVSSFGWFRIIWFTKLSEITWNVLLKCSD